jgi:prepilin-type N-terminal cleavage/methylation domain-containing protein
MKTSRDCSCREVLGAFTLIELLVVIGLIAVLAGGIGLSLGKGDSGISLQNGQGIMISSLSAARAQAAMNLQNAAVFVNSNPTSDRFLRELRIAVDVDPTPAFNWRIRGDGILLPKGVYLAPPISTFTPAQVQYLPASGDWTNILTTAYTATGDLLKDSAGNNISSDTYDKIVSLTPRGTTLGRQIVLSLGEIRADGKIVFDKPDFVRGLKVSQYGIATAIQDPSGFQ